MFNKVLLQGNLGRDVELKTLQTGMQIATFSMAMTEKGSDNVERTEWANVIAFNQMATAIANLKKGNNVFVIGRMQTRNWEKDGKKQYKTEVVASGVFVSVFTLGKSPQQLQPEPAYQNQQPQQAQGQPVEDDIPF
jgi:single-strand DNA-binding protein